MKAYEKLLEHSAKGKLLSGIAPGHSITFRQYAVAHFKEHAHQMSIGEVDHQKLIEELDFDKYAVLAIDIDSRHQSVIDRMNESIDNGYLREATDMDAIALLHKEHNILLVLTGRYASLFCLQAKAKEMFVLGTLIVEKYGIRAEEDEFGDIGILTKTDKRDYEIQDLEIANPEATVEESYPEQISREHADVVEILSRKKDAKGIILMHGEPGTGKTTYIRHLIKSVKKKFVFVSPDVAGEFGNPAIAKVLLELANCVLVIEDGEKVLKTREKDMPSPISALLNLSDGLISDALHIQVIATFNCELGEIDPAIMRKGRLLKRLTFPEMGIEQANKIRAKLKKPLLGGSRSKTFTVAEVYND